MKVDFIFPVCGRKAPTDGREVFSALCSVVKALDSPGVMVSYLYDGAVRRGRIAADLSYIVIRADDSIGRSVVGLSGATVNIDGDIVSIGSPTVRMLSPHGVLESLAVCFRGIGRRDFVRMVIDDIHSLGISGVEVFVRNMAGCRTVGVSGVIGRPVVVSGLDRNGSVKLQSEGIGRMKRFGYGMFFPAFPAQAGLPCVGVI